MSGSRAWDGALPSGGAWAIDVPDPWNGTLCVFSSGYGEAGSGRVDNAGDPVTREHLLALGYALAGTRAATAGWVVGDTLVDQVAVVAEFRARVGAPDVTIAWGRSMGGLIAAALAQVAPDTFDGAVALCASLAGPVPMLNQGLDAAFVATVLCGDGDDIALVGVEDDVVRSQRGRRLVERAASSAAGRARLALASAVAQLPTWTSDNLLSHRAEPPEPAPGEVETMLALQRSVFPLVAFSPRADLERRARGNFSWNDGIDYTAQLQRSGLADLVDQAYVRAAGAASLEDDLARVADTSRITRDDDAVRFMEQNLTPDGFIGVPVLTVSLTGDFAPTVSQASAYADVVAEAGCSTLLRQAYVHAPGHCSAFSVAEILTAVKRLDDRARHGEWRGVDADALNAEASVWARRTWPALKRPRFAAFTPDAFLRPHRRADRVAPLTGRP